MKYFIKGIEPLEEHEKLGALLLQLSPSFSPRKHSLEELDTICECLGKRTLAVELRNRDWVTGSELVKTKRFFADRKITFVVVDGPDDPHFMVMPYIDLLTNPQLCYFRAHGRNAKGYVRGRDVATRFNYDYKKFELEQIAERSSELATKAAEVHVVFNNNHSDYAPRAASTFQEIVHEEHPESLRLLV